jgi:hypothetical protein
MAHGMNEYEQRCGRMRDYLLAVVDRDQMVADLLFHCVGRVQLKTGADLEISKMTEALDLLSEVRHIADWLRVSINDEATWLQSVDKYGRPKKLLKFGTMSAITAEADRFFRRKKAQQQVEIKISEGDEELHFDLGDGWWLVKLLTPTALDRESQLMQHCIGHGSYDHRLSDDGVAFLSLRDPRGFPHATIHIDRGFVVQFQGKQNANPIQAYTERCLPYFSDRTFSRLPPGIIKDVSGKAYSIFDLPASLHVDGDVIIRNSVENLRLPDVIEATGSVMLGGIRCANVPSRIKAGANLEIHGSVVDRLPDEFEVKGDIDLSQSTIEKLPENMTVWGRLTLFNSGITEIPKGLTVHGSLNIVQTAIESLPDDMRCAGINMSNTRIERFDTAAFGTDADCGTSRDLFANGSCLKEIVGIPRFRDLDVSRSSFEILPDELQVDGELSISKTAIRKISQGMKINNLTAEECCLRIETPTIRGYVSLSKSHVSMPQTFACGAAFLRNTTFEDVQRIKAGSIQFWDGPISVELVADKVDFQGRKEPCIDGKVVARRIDVIPEVEFIGEDVSAETVRVGVRPSAISLADAKKILLDQGNLHAIPSEVATVDLPTGRGRATFMETILSRPSSWARNIVTIEDPPEYLDLVWAAPARAGDQRH